MTLRPVLDTKQAEVDSSRSFAFMITKEEIPYLPVATPSVLIVSFWIDLLTSLNSKYS